MKPRPIVLLASDSARARIALADLLRRSNFVVIETDDGASAVRLALDHQPNVIVVDEEMPRLDGIAAAATMRSFPALASVPIVLIGSSIEHWLLDLSDRIGGISLVTRSYSLLALLAEIRYWTHPGASLAGTGAVINGE